MLCVGYVSYCGLVSRFIRVVACCKFITTHSIDMCVLSIFCFVAKRPAPFVQCSCMLQKCWEKNEPRLHASHTRIPYEREKKTTERRINDGFSVFFLFIRFFSYVNRWRIVLNRMNSTIFVVCVWSPLFLLPPKRIGSFKRKNGKKMLNRKNSEQQQQEILYFNGIERWSIHTCLLVDSIPYVLVLSVHKAVGGSCCKKSFLSFVWIEIIRSDSFSCIIFVACA